MTALIGGIGGLVLGIILLVVWWGYFIALLAGAIPLVLLLGGALATYLGIEEYKDKLERDKMEQEPIPAPPAADERYKEETEQYKQEVESLKQEIEELKAKKES